MDLKHLGRNTVVYGVGNFFLRFTRFALIPLYTRLLSPGDYGLLLTLLATVEVVKIFMGLQMSPALIRYYKESERDRTEGTLLGTSILVEVLASVAFAAICMVCAAGLTLRVGWSADILRYAAPVCILAASEALYLHVISYHRARNQAVRFMVESLAGSILVVLASAAVLGLGGPWLGALLFGHAASYAVVGAVVLLRICRTVRPSFSLGLVPRLFSFGAPLVLSASAWFVLELADKYFLAYFRSLEEVAIYGVGYKVASILVMTVVVPFQIAYGPFTFAILEEEGARRKLARIFFYLVLAMGLVAVAVALASPVVVHVLAPPSYRSAALVALCILPAGVLLGLFQWASALIHIAKKTYLIGILMAFVSILNLALNFLLVPRMGWLGAALATNLSFLVAVVVLFILGLRLYPVPLLAEARAELRRLRKSRVWTMGLAEMWRVSLAWAPELLGRGGR